MKLDLANAKVIVETLVDGDTSDSILTVPACISLALYAKDLQTRLEELESRLLT